MLPLSLNWGSYFWNLWSKKFWLENLYRHHKFFWHSWINCSDVTTILIFQKAIPSALTFNFDAFSAFEIFLKQFRLKCVFFNIPGRFGCSKDRREPDLCRAVLHLKGGQYVLKTGHTCKKESHESKEVTEFKNLFIQACQQPGAGKPSKIFEELKNQLLFSILSWYFIYTLSFTFLPCKGFLTTEMLSDDHENIRFLVKKTIIPWIRYF